MKLLILGATGRVGRPTVDRALAEGHTVTAYVRSSAKLSPRSGLTVIEGDVSDHSALRDAASGMDAVLCLIASPSLRNGSLLQSITPGIVRAVHAAGVSRFVFASVFGVGPTLKLASPLARVIYRTIARPFMTDRAAAETVVNNSGLDHVIVYLLNLSDLPRDDYRLVPLNAVARVGGLPRFPYLSAADAVIEAAVAHERPAPRVLVASTGQWVPRG